MREAANSNQRMIMTSEKEDLLLDVGIPDESFVIEACTNKTLVHWTPVAPVKTVDSFFMASELFFRRVCADVPEADVSI
jgi:hypothetical protein